MIGPVFSRELITAPRRPRLYVLRSIYPAAILLLICTAWLVLAGTQVVRDVGDMARFGAILFQLLAPLQLGLVVFFAALSTASAVAQEKDRRTLILLLMTRLENREIVLGKLMAALLNVLVMLATAVPLFMLVVMFGGVSVVQVVRVFAVTLGAALAAGSLGATMAFWREKTFQALALTALVLIFWLGLGEAVASGLWGPAPGGVSSGVWAAAISPLRAVWLASRPWYSALDAGSTVAWLPDTGSWQLPPAVLAHLIVVSLVTLLLNLVAVVRLRVWNPSREVRAVQRRERLDVIWSSGQGSEQGSEHEAAVRAEQARSGHVDAVLRQREGRRSRHVWNNPVLWREVCTWAYGKKVIAIRAGYWLLFAMAVLSLHWILRDPTATLAAEDGRTVVQATARPMIPLFFVSLVIVNALAVTSITNERDGKSLDLLLVTDLSPREFVFGKLAGVLWVTKDMVLLPVLLCCYLYWVGHLELGHLTYVVGGLIVMYVFVTMLGMHCGMTYSNSRTAIGLSLGTVFFLFLGVVTCILLMISFSGSFQIQLFPFLAFIAGGSVGLFASLGARNPSNAIASASLLLPLATFYAITSFLMGYTLGVFLVVAATYGFATAAMMVPALSEFDFADGRTPQDE